MQVNKVLFFNEFKCKMDLSAVTAGAKKVFFSQKTTLSDQLLEQKEKKN